MEKKMRFFCASAIAALCVNGVHAQWTNTGTVVHPVTLTNNVSVGTTVNGANFYVEKTNAVTLGIKSQTAGATMFMDKGTTTANAAFAYKLAGVTQWNSGMLGGNNFSIRNVVANTFPFLITQTDLVGVGTLTPTNKLTIVATGPTAGLGIYSSNNLRIGMDMGRNNAAELSMGIADGPSSFVTGSVAGDVVFRTNSGANKFLFASGGGGAPVALAITPTSVGIGTTSPSSPLTVVSAAANIPAVKILPFGSSFRAVLAVDDWGLLQDYFGTAQNKDFSIYQYSKGLHRLLIDTSGKVGIGTTTPSNILHIVDQGSTNVAGIINLQSPNMPATGSLTALVMGKNGAVEGNQVELRYEYYGDGDDRNGYAFGMNSIQPFVRFTKNERVSIGGNSTPGGQFELSLDEGRKPSTSTWTITSDARLKNIDGAYTKGLAEIMQLNPIAYHYKNVGNKKFDEKTIATQAVGFAAQDVQKVFPEAVGTDNDGYLNLNIHSIIIAQVNAIKELKMELDEMKSENTDLKSCIESLCNSATAESKVGQSIDQDALFQNQPNPFNAITTIRYSLTKGGNAQIIIRDLSGNHVKSFNLAQSGKGQVTVNANELAQGTYTYTLIVNGNAIDTKLMVITK